VKPGELPIDRREALHELPSGMIASDDARLVRAMSPTAVIAVR
jgi:hypothetical protein